MTVPFGEGFARPDDHSSRELLDYLERVSRVPAVTAAKQAVTESLRLRPGQRVLEVGCGTGPDLGALADAVAPDGTVLGLEPFAAALETARRRVSGHPRIELHPGRVEALPLPDRSVDACRADRVLQHVGDPAAGLRELRRVLRRGGRLGVLEIGSSLKVAGTDAAITKAVTGRMLGARPADWIPLWMPVLLREAGFERVELTVTEATSGRWVDADAMLRLEAGAAEAIRDGELEQAAVARWLAAGRAAARRGELCLTLRCVTFSAAAP